MEINSQTETDAKLVSRARLGDAVAFGELVSRHRSSAHRTARAILRSSSDADDVVQEAWLQAYVHLTRFQGAASFRTWVLAIVRNHAIDHHRSARRRLLRNTALEPGGSIQREAISGASSPEELVLRAERRDRLRQAIQRLPPRLSEPLRLWHSGKYNYGEIARIAGVTIGTIKSRVWEARQQVTHALVD